MENNLSVGVKSNFITYVEQTMSYADYVMLDEQLKLSPHMTTKILNDPARMTLAIMYDFARLLKITPVELYQRFGAGASELTDNEKLLLSNPPHDVPMDQIVASTNA